MQTTRTEMEMCLQRKIMSYVSVNHLDIL